MSRFVLSQLNSAAREAHICDQNSARNERRRVRHVEESVLNCRNKRRRYQRNIPLRRIVLSQLSPASRAERICQQKCERNERRNTRHSVEKNHAVVEDVALQSADSIMAIDTDEVISSVFCDQEPINNEDMSLLPLNVNLHNSTLKDLVNSVILDQRLRNCNVDTLRGVKCAVKYDLDTIDESEITEHYCGSMSFQCPYCKARF